MFNTQIVGILNVTPDSFSDGGRYFSREAAVQHIEKLLEEGADIIDIGAESTRPGALPLTPDEEWQRLEPVLESLAQFSSARFSIDTRHHQTVHKVIPIPGIYAINDVSGFSDSHMIEAVRESGRKLVMMHSLTVPADKTVVMPESADVVTALLDFARQRMSMLEQAGIRRDRIIFDPGIGFGKTPRQSLDILRCIHRFKALGVPIYVGHSRKSFLAGYDRDSATLAVSQFLIAQRVDYLRVHDVAAHRKLMALMNELYHE